MSDLALGLATGYSLGLNEGEQHVVCDCVQNVTHTTYQMSPEITVLFAFIFGGIFGLVIIAGWRLTR